jgi:hemolysin III
MRTTEERVRSLAEECTNAITHGLGAVFITAASPFLLAEAFRRGGAMAVVCASIFAATAISLYTASTLYHAIRPGRLKQALQSVDHSAIFLLIAGTYTPFMLGALRGGWGWSLFGVVWGLAMLGILQELFSSTRPRIPAILLYLAMGWLAIVAVVPLVTHVRLGGLALILAGGLAYTVGVVFYAIQRVPYFHTVWHFFVLMGTACHFFAVMNYAA